RLRAAERSPGLKVAGLAIDRRDVEYRIAANQVLLDPRAVRCGQKALLVDPNHRRIDERHARAFQRDRVQLQEKVDLVFKWNVERIFFERALPARGRRLNRYKPDGLSLKLRVGARN